MFYMCYSFLAFKSPPLSKRNPTVYSRMGAKLKGLLNFQ